MPIRVPAKADTDTVNAFQDVEKRLQELESKLRAITELEQKVKVLETPTELVIPTYITQGDTVIEGDLRVEGNTTIRGNVSAPQLFNGIIQATPAALTSAAQQVVEVHGSLAVLNAISADTLYTRRMESTPVWCKAMKGSTASPGAADQWNLVPFEGGVLEFDTDGMHSNTVNNSRLTVQSQGVYLVVASIISQQAATQRYIAITKNGTTIAEYGPWLGLNAGTERREVIAISFAVPGDYFQVYTYFVGTALTVDVNSWFSAVRIS